VRSRYIISHDIKVQLANERMRWLTLSKVTRPNISCSGSFIETTYFVPPSVPENRYPVVCQSPSIESSDVLTIALALGDASD
jgi:hypothetical protein